MVKRIVGVGLVFVIGVGVGWTLLRIQSGRPAGTKEAQTRAIQVLDRTPPTLAADRNEIVTAVKKIEPAVVNIDTIGVIQTEGALPFVPREGEVRGKGSGVIVTSDGYIITNNHVIEGASKVRVTLTDNRWFYAKLVGTDPQTDLAVVRVEATNLPTAELADSDGVQVGEWSIALGNPLGIGSSVSLGIVSAVNRRNLQIDETRIIDGAIQTDAAVNRGNSGGALANASGQLIGINTAILSSGPGGGSIGLGFAIPSNTVRRIMREIIATGKSTPVTVEKAWLGIQFDAVPETISTDLGIEAGRGVLVKSIIPGSPAVAAGLQKDDVITMIGGNLIGDQGDVRQVVSLHKVGEKIPVKVLRHLGGEKEIIVTLGARPATLGFR